MNHDTFFIALAEYNSAHWWVRAVLTLAVIWLFIDLVRGAPWAQVGLKVALALTCFSVGVFYYGLFLPSALGPEVPALQRVWLGRIGTAVFIAAGVVGIIDAAGNGTRLVLPERGWRLAAVVGGTVLGLGFPAFELLVGHTWPHAQAFGLAPAPILIVLLPLLGGARQMAWTGQVWFWLMFLAGAEAGVVAQLLGVPHAQPVVAAVLVGGLVMRFSAGAKDADTAHAR